MVPDKVVQELDVVGGDGCAVGFDERPEPVGRLVLGHVGLGTRVRPDLLVLEGVEGLQGAAPGHTGTGVGLADLGDADHLGTKWAVFESGALLGFAVSPTNLQRYELA